MKRVGIKNAGVDIHDDINSMWIFASLHDQCLKTLLALGRGKVIKNDIYQLQYILPQEVSGRMVIARLTFSVREK